VLVLLVLSLLSLGGLITGPFWQLSADLGRMSVICLSILIASYLAGNLAASAVTAGKNSWSLFPLLPAVFACYHFGYGYGFLRGVWDFVLRRKAANRDMLSLSRCPL
jgi:hypothetical protein